MLHLPGPGGVGHFVKTVHNGIRNMAICRLISEAYFIMQELLGMQAGEINQVFESWNGGELESYLMRSLLIFFRALIKRLAGPWWMLSWTRQSRKAQEVDRTRSHGAGSAGTHHSRGSLRSSTIEPQGRTSLGSSKTRRAKTAIQGDKSRSWRT